MQNTNNKRLIDITVEELVEILDQRYLESKSKRVTVPIGDRNIKVQECAEITGYKEEYVRQLVFKKEIPFFKQNNRSLRFSYNEIVEWTRLRKHIPIEDAAQQYIENTPIGKQGRFYNR